MPTEAQWEYAARADTKSDYYWGEGEAKDFAWFNENSNSKTHPVGEKKHNDFGLHDMSGNVWEWVEDCWHKNYKDAPPDGKAWDAQYDGDCSLRVLRGGAWDTDAKALRSASRGQFRQDVPFYTTGFRLAQN